MQEIYNRFFLTANNVKNVGYIILKEAFLCQKEPLKVSFRLVNNSKQGQNSILPFLFLFTKNFTISFFFK